MNTQEWAAAHSRIKDKYGEKAADLHWLLDEYYKWANASNLFMPASTYDSALRGAIKTTVELMELRESVLAEYKMAENRSASNVVE